MKFIQLFISLSCVSAALSPILEVLNEEKPNNSSVEATINNSLSNNAALKERLIVEYAHISGPLVVEEPQMSPNPNFNPENYEILLEQTFRYTTDTYATAIMEAYGKGKIDFNYIPRYQYFYRGLLTYKSLGCNEVLLKYFKVGTIEKMRKSGLIKYADILKTAVIFDRYAAATKMLDYIVEAMLNEIDSEDFDETEWKLDPRIYDIFVASTHCLIKRNNKVELQNHKEDIEFFYKYNRIFGIVPEANDCCCVIA